MGGDNSSTTHNYNHCYNIEENTWTTLTVMPAIRTQHTAVTVGYNIYVMGGYYDDYHATMYCYVV